MFLRSERHGNEELDPNLLWTIRSAINNGHDINLPRAIGVNAKEAIQKAKAILSQIGNKGIVIYYPFFIADKSGIVEVKEKKTIIEAVQGDLWNLTTNGKKDVTIIIDRYNHEPEYHGNKYFLDDKEIYELLRYSARVRVKFKDEIFDNSSVMLEWSYAFNTDTNRKPIGNRYLVFYECRSVK